MINIEQKNIDARLSVSKKAALTAGAAAALLSGTDTTSADIVLNENSFTVSFSNPGTRVSWDVDGVGGVDFEFLPSVSPYFSEMFLFSNSLNGAGLVGPGIPYYSYNIQRLESGFVAGPTLATYAWASKPNGRNIMLGSGSYANYPMFFTGPQLEGFSNVDSGFVGFRFDTNGQEHYGWAEWNFDYDVGSLTISRWAYESDPDTGIRVGDTVPEPGSLALLAMGAAGALISRRRTRDAPNETSA